MITILRKIIPTTHFLIAIILSIIFQLFLPVKQIFAFPCNFIGVLFVILGVFINIWADRLFKRDETSVKPFAKSSSLILDGPFVFSRNPMYLGMFIALIGISTLLGSLSTFIFPITFLVLMNTIFIPLEEKTLIETFGKNYELYMTKVRRWL